MFLSTQQYIHLRLQRKLVLCSSMHSRHVRYLYLMTHQTPGRGSGPLEKLNNVPLIWESLKGRHKSNSTSCFHVLHMTNLPLSFWKFISDTSCHFPRFPTSLESEVQYTTGSYLKPRQKIIFSFICGHWDDISSSVIDESSMLFFCPPPKVPSYQGICQKPHFIHSNLKTENSWEDICIDKGSGQINCLALLLGQQSSFTKKTMLILCCHPK